MPARNLADQLTELLASLEVGPAADSAAARALARLEPAEAVYVLKVLVERAKGSHRVGHALVIASRALCFGPDADLSPEQRSRIYQAATDFTVPEVAALFIRDAPALQIDPGLVDQPDPVIGHLTLGHKKMLARKVDADRIGRFALEPDSRVIRELLLNPRLTEDMVLRIVSRRPARVPVLMEIWRSTRWSVRRRVRQALAMNPYTPPEVALKVLPQLTREDLSAIASDGALHPSVRALAARLCRPGLRAGRALDEPAEQVADGGEAAGQHHEDQHQDQHRDLALGQIEAGHRKSD
ncbi:MAG: hypothetical protein HY901_29650 [Deltaproteobacteria bacterium]|nr:hypothetical protein [Deltaproteobacteria bacterium]